MIGFHCSHELYPPGELLDIAQHAVRAGFTTFSCSDHFHPWSADGQSGFAWSWLGAALERCSGEFGAVCAPGQRYHPAIIAQAAATLAEMYPDRFWVALGTGENLNEHITGDPWPGKDQRQRRLEECVSVMRRLWSGEHVTHQGLVNVQDAKLYSLPELPPRIFGAAVTDETAEWVGSWADGLLTVAKPPEALSKTVAAFHRGGGVGKPMRLQAAVALDTTEQMLKATVYRRWGVGCLQVSELQDVATPEEFDRRIAGHSPEEVCENLRVSTDLGEHLRWIHDDLALGFETVYLHYVGRDIRRFIDVFGREVLPEAP